MSSRFVTVPIALILSFAFITPAAVLIGPLPVRAQTPIGVPTGEVNPLVVVPTGVTSAKTTISAFQEILTQVNTFLTQVATYAQWVNTFILQPLAFVMSGNLLKALTAGVVKFVIGQANGNGNPQFATNVQRTLQLVSDIQALAYIKQVGLTNSPFATSIRSALNTRYLQNSSLAGFWAANQCTLSAVSPDIQQYLAGNWSKGGIAAWFALTIRPQNNPYLLYMNSQAQLANVVVNAMNARSTELNWGQGFMSWCSASTEAQKAANTANTEYKACAANCSSSSNPVGCVAQCETRYGEGGGANPGDACTTTDGSAGTIQTPGSVIKATLDKVLGSQQDKLVQMGNIGSQINQIMSSISTIVQTVNLAQNILGGGSSGGLLNSGPMVTTFAPTRDSSGNFSSGYFTVTPGQINSDAASSTSAMNQQSNDRSNTAQHQADLENAATKLAGLSVTARAQLYKASWATIGTAAGTSQTNVQALIAACTASVDDMKANQNTGYYSQAFIDAAMAQIAEAQAALSSIVTPAVNTASAAPGIADAAIAMDTQVQNELANNSPNYQADLQKLQDMPPSLVNTYQAQQDAITTNNAKADPTGSLKIVPSTQQNFSTLVDRLNLLGTNATQLISTVCNPNYCPGGCR